MVVKVNQKRSKKAAKSHKSKNKASKSTRALKSRHVAAICAEINSKRGSNGRIPRGEMLRVFNEYKPIYSWLTIDIIKKGLKRSTVENLGNNNTAIISDITDLTETTDVTMNTNPIPPPASIGFVSDCLPSEEKATGRPKGTTVKASREKLESIEVMINSIVAEWKEKVDATTGRMPNHALDTLILKKRKNSISMMLKLANHW